MKYGKAAGLGGLALTIGVTGIIGANSQASAASARPATPAAASAGVASGPGCAATSATVPAGANRATIGDVDGDGRADTLWNSGDRFGVHTASGATFSGAFANAGGPEASVEAIDLGDGSHVVMEMGRLDYTNAVVDCRIVATANVQGDQYAFDHGFLRSGSNWGVATIKGKKQLVGLQLRTISASDGFYGVDETPIVLHRKGETATNGQVVHLTHNGRIFMSREVADAKIDALVEAGRSGPIVTTPGT